VTREAEIRAATQAACFEQHRGQSFLARARRVPLAHQGRLFRLYRLRMAAVASEHFARALWHLQRARATGFDVRRRVPGQDEYARCGHQHPTERAAQECMRELFGDRPYGMVRPHGAPDFDELHTPEQQQLAEIYQAWRLEQATAIARANPPTRHTRMELCKAGVVLCLGQCVKEAPADVGLCFDCHARIYQEAQRQIPQRGQLPLF
jgi:hypothetical protein